MADSLATARVAWLFEFPALNGGERSLLATTDHLRAAGFDLHAIAPAEGPLAEALLERDVPNHPLPPVDRSQQARREVLRVALESLRPDLLHANSLSMSRLSGPVVRQLGVPSLGHLRDIMKVSRQGVADLNCHRRLLSVSLATAKYHIARGLDAQRCQVLYNGVDLSLFRPAPPSGYLHRELGLPPQALLIGMAGQIILRKGQDVLAAAARLLAEMQDVHYVFIGQRHSEKPETVAFEESLRQSFKQSGQGNQVHFLGMRQDIPRVLNELTLLVHPARQEPLGRVLLEAAAAGIPVVATDVGGTREIFPAREQALLVPADDPYRMALAIWRLLHSPELRRSLATEARKRAEAAFAISLAAEGLSQHYRQVLAGQV